MAADGTFFNRPKSVSRSARVVHFNSAAYISLKALRRYSHEHYATMPQECRNGHSPNGPCPHGHAWPLWGVYAIARIIQDCYPDFEIRTTGRVYNDQGVVFHDRQVVVRKDAPSPRTWQLSHCMDDEINEILTPAQVQFSAVYRKHLDHVAGGLVSGREGLMVLVSGMTESVMNSAEIFVTKHDTSAPIHSCFSTELRPRTAGLGHERGAESPSGRCPCLRLRPSGAP